MTDKERILTYLFHTFYPKYILGNTPNYTESLKDIKIGDLVLSVSSGIHAFSIGYVTKILDKSEMIIREIGSGNTCHISNDMFLKIDISDLDQNQFLEGEQYKFYIKIKEIFDKNNRINNKVYYLHHVSFYDAEIEVHLRERFGEYNIENPIKFILDFNMDITEEEVIKAANDQIK